MALSRDRRCDSSAARPMIDNTTSRPRGAPLGVNLSDMLGLACDECLVHQPLLKDYTYWKADGSDTYSGCCNPGRTMVTTRVSRPSKGSPGLWIQY
jgi:hypothetical protein